MQPFVIWLSGNRTGKKLLIAIVTIIISSFDLSSIKIATLLQGSTSQWKMSKLAEKWQKWVKLYGKFDKYQYLKSLVQNMQVESEFWINHNLNDLVHCIYTYMWA